MAKAKTAKQSGKKKMIADEGARGGFTIIEVVLVLAIAGLIFLMVFLALPALQRSQRDTERRNAMARLSSQVTQYQTNNNGRLPGDKTATVTAAAVADGGFCSEANAACTFLKNYMNGVGAVENEFVDPSGWSYGLTLVPDLTGDFELTRTGDEFDKHLAYIVRGAKCDGEKAVKSSNSRDFVIMYILEGSGIYCNN